jgi:hypothetical protein
MPAGRSLVAALKNPVPSQVDPRRILLVIFVLQFFWPRELSRRIRKAMNCGDYWKKLMVGKLTEVMLIAWEFVQFDFGHSLLHLQESVLFRNLLAPQTLLQLCDQPHNHSGLRW